MSTILDIPANVAVTDYNLFPIDPTRGICVVVFIEVIRSNPNGDVDNAGRPRIDSFDRLFMRNAAIKRKIRDSAKLNGVKLWMDHGINLQRSFDPYINGKDEVEMERAYADLWDLRLFGGTAPVEGKTKLWNGKPIRNVGAGPMQLTDAVSLDPVTLTPIGLTRVAHGKETEDGDARANMGNYSIAEAAVLRLEIEYLPHNAAGVTADDLRTFFKALIECWGDTRSAARTGVNVRQVYLFDFARTNMEPKHVMLSRVLAENQGDVTGIESYRTGVNTRGLPAGVGVTIWNDGSVQKHQGDVGVIEVSPRVFTF